MAVALLDMEITLSQARQIGQDNLTIIKPMANRLLTLSAGQREIKVTELGDPSLPTWFLIGGLHGDEPEGSHVVVDFIKYTEKKHKNFKTQVIVIPKFNPDGLELLQRTNSRGVDLNRNFPSKDWTPEHKSPRYFPGAEPNSESETQALVTLLERHKPFLVVHCHTYKPQVCYTGPKSKRWAQLIGKTFNHPVTEDIGYPTPGSLGQFCLLNLDTACVCVELPEHIERTQAWNQLGPSLLEIAQHGP